MILSGGFVAGTKAGFSFNTFPMMNGQWVPNDLLAMTPVWRNYFENIVTIQFIHRCLAVIVLTGVALVWAMVKWWLPSRFTVRLVWLLLFALAVQLTLGIATLLYVVPVPLAVAHQGGAVLLLTVAILLYRDVSVKANS